MLFYQSITDVPIRKSLETWINTIKNPKLNWHHFSTNLNPIDPKNPIIDIILPQLMSRPKFDNIGIIIETFCGLELFRGIINNGHIKGYVEPELVNHPAWRSRLTIGLLDSHSNPFQVPLDVNERVIFLLIYKLKCNFKKFEKS